MYGVCCRLPCAILFFVNLEGNEQKQNIKWTELTSHFCDHFGRGFPGISVGNGRKERWVSLT